MIFILGGPLQISYFEKISAQSLLYVLCDIIANLQLSSAYVL
jgi:hypothetical protein